MVVGVMEAVEVAWAVGVVVVWAVGVVAVWVVGVGVNVEVVKV